MFSDPTWAILGPKNPKNGPKMAIFKGFLLPDQLWSHFWGGCRAGLGEYDTLLEPWGRVLPEYVIKRGSRPGIERARAQNVKKGQF